MDIAEILKYCPEGTKLYSLIDGEVTLKSVNIAEQYPIETVNDDFRNNYYTKDGLFFSGCPDGECMLFPSKEQRDWSKFRIPIKKGDIMMSMNKRAFIANGKIDNDGCPCVYCGINLFHDFTIGTTINGWTSLFYIPASEEAKKELFDKMVEAGYKWNTKTLKLEKIEPKFKEGDVLINETNTLFLFTGVMIGDMMQGYYLFDNNTFACSCVSVSLLKLASEEDKNKLLSAIIKGGYRYDKEQHNLIKQEFKQFDKVLVRNATNEKWSINLFSYYNEENKYFPYVCLDGSYIYCIPYEGNEYVLGTTTNIIK